MRPSRIHAAESFFYVLYILHLACCHNPCSLAHDYTAELQNWEVVRCFSSDSAFVSISIAICLQKQTGVAYNSNTSYLQQQGYPTKTLVALVSHSGFGEPQVSHRCLAGLGLIDLKVSRSRPLPGEVIKILQYRCRYFL